MNKLINYFSKLKNKNNLTKTQIYLSTLGILLFLGLVISLPLIIINFNKNQNIAKSHAAGNAWHVDNTVAVSGDGTSWSSAWKNFSNINWLSINPGDTIYISGGTSSKSYYETLTIGKSGTTGSPITITKGLEAGHNGNVIIDGQNTRYYGVNIGYNTTSQNYVVVKNLTAQNFADGAGLHVRYSNSGVIFENNYVFTGSGNNSSPSRGIDVRGSSNVIVRNNTVNTPSSTAAQTDGIWSSGNNGVIFDNNTVIISNTDTTGHSDGIQSYQDINITVSNNYFSQAGGRDNHGMWITNTVTGGTIDVYNNVLYMATSETFGLTHWNQSYPEYNGRARFYNNTIYGANPGIQLRESPNSEAKNNIVTVYGSNNWGAIYLYGNVPAGSTINNNLLWTTSGAPIAKINDVIKTWTEWQSTGRDVNGINADPIFSNIAAKDFTLQQSSPAIDAGAALAIVTSDKNGISRPQGNVYDIGAYEYISTSYSTPSPSIPSPTASASPTITNTPSPIPTNTSSPTPAADTTPPNINITYPFNNGTVARNRNTTITASASDNIGVAKVEFYVNNVLKCTDTVASYSCRWRVPNSKNVQYAISAKAYDAKNNTAISSITVTAK